jgi:hypothetical protein
MSKTVVNVAEVRVGNKGLRRVMSRRNVLIVAIVASVLIGVVVATSLAPVSKLKITLVNLSRQDLLVHVWVDKFEARHAILGPGEEVSFSWNTAGWPVHKYDILAYPPNMLVFAVEDWRDIVVLPFTEKAITLSNPSGFAFRPA